MITIVVGAQYGGEGKGKVSAFLAWKRGIAVACRCGGPNSSHAVEWRGKTHRLRMFPTAAVVNPQIEVYFGAGTLIHIPTLFRERAEIGFTGSLVVDPQAGIVTDDVIVAQRGDKRYADIGSTLTGTGYASALRCQRSLPLAREFESLAPYLGPVAELIHLRQLKGRHILLEGHQGFGLSNYHGTYPFTSSRDSTASSMLAEVGLGPIQKGGLTVLLATKLFPTRNHAGPIEQEIPTDQLKDLHIEEFGGGAWDLPNRRRRVGQFDADTVRKAVIANSANEIALTGIDYMYRDLAGMNDLSRADQKTRMRLEELIDLIERYTGARVRYLSTGPATDAMYDRQSDKNDETRPVELAGGTH